jgi:hypothetical protein
MKPPAKTTTPAQGKPGVCVIFLNNFPKKSRVETSPGQRRRAKPRRRKFMD